MDIDLDAAKAARREASKEGPVVVFGGQRFPLQPELPFEAAEHLLYGRLREAIALIFNGGHEEFMALKPSTEDLRLLLDVELPKAYGSEDLGESPASLAQS